MESQSSFDAYRMPDAMWEKSVCFCLITRPVCSEADHGEIYDPSRTQFSSDYVRVANGKRFPRVLLQAVRHSVAVRNMVENVFDCKHQVRIFADFELAVGFDNLVFRRLVGSPCHGIPSENASQNEDRRY